MYTRLTYVPSFDQSTFAGRIRNLLRAGKLTLDHVFRFSVASDLAKGMSYLHRNHLIHGQLTINSVYVDRSWNVVVGDWEQNELHYNDDEEFIPFEAAYIEAHNTLDHSSRRYNYYFCLLFWIAPEILHKNAADVLQGMGPTKAADVYSYSMILYEIFLEQEPFEHLVQVGRRW